MAFQINSPAFENGGMIPSKYTCDGDNVSPPLKWTDAPKSTLCFALINDDPDAPMGTWVHWVMYNIPVQTQSLDENVPKTSDLKNGARQGMTDFGRTGYGGPCPPSGIHRYFFKLYALDTMLTLPKDVTKSQLLSAMKGHILAETQMLGRYKRMR